MAATLTPTSNYVDVGANIGDMLVHALAYAPEGRHIAVEPLPELCDITCGRRDSTTCCRRATSPTS